MTASAALTDHAQNIDSQLFMLHEFALIDTLVSLIMLDVNRFKDINDSYGHLAGDQVLKELAGVLQHNVRSCDTVTRNGGDEFALILPGTTTSEAVHIMSRIEEAVAQHIFSYDGNNIRVTVSWGAITSKCAEIESLNRIIAQADKKLYNMKKAKKRKVIGNS